MATKLSELLAQKGVLLADGATGTNFFEMGLMSGDAPELWITDEPAKVEALHQSFVDAGADIILTNTFGATRNRLKLHKIEDRCHELNKKAAEICRKVADSAGRPVIVAGSVGPTGELFEPLGELTHETAKASFSQQIKGLIDGGVDVIWIETMSAREEIEAAASAARELGMEYVFTASFDTAGKTMMGIPPSDLGAIAAAMSPHPVAFGANCGVGASDLLSSVLDMSATAPCCAVVAKANCGIPQFEGEKIVYSGTPELMDDYVRLAVDAGAKIIGGCCGTSAIHLAAMRKALDEHIKGSRPNLEQIEARIGPMVNSRAIAADAMPKREKRGRRRVGV